MSYIVVAYFTEYTPYAEEVQHLIQSLKRFNLPADIVGIPSQGSWQANVHYKATFIKQMLTRHAPKDILYLDADARVQQYPTLFDQVDFDLGYVAVPSPDPKNAFNRFYALLFPSSAEDKNLHEILGCALYFSNNEKILTLIDLWIKSCRQNPKIWESVLFQIVLEKHSKEMDLKIKNLPLTYCQIFDYPDMKIAGPPVIEQFQASRRFREIIDKWY